MIPSGTIIYADEVAFNATAKTMHGRYDELQRLLDTRQAPKVINECASLLSGAVSVRMINDSLEYPQSGT
jgi:hypothetical protein